MLASARAACKRRLPALCGGSGSASGRVAGEAQRARQDSILKPGVGAVATRRERLVRFGDDQVTHPRTLKHDYMVYELYLCESIL